MPFLYAAQAIGGVSNLALSAVLTALIIRFIPQENQSTAMGLYQALYGIGMTLGPVLTGGIAGRYSYCAAYLTIAGLCLGAALLAPWLVGKVEKN